MRWACFASCKTSFTLLHRSKQLSKSTLCNQPFLFNCLGYHDQKKTCTKTLTSQSISPNKSDFKLQLKKVCKNLILQFIQITNRCTAFQLFILDRLRLNLKNFVHGFDLLPIPVEKDSVSVAPKLINFSQLRFQ